MARRNNSKSGGLTMAQLYNSGIGILADGTVSWATSPIVALIVDSGQVFDVTDVFVSDVVADEVTNATGTGYARKTLTGKTVTVDQVNDRVVFDASDVTYTAVETNETWDAVILYLDTGTDATSRLLCYVSIDALVTNGSDATVQWASTGIFRINNP
jgi:hypothetical protein